MPDSPPPHPSLLAGADSVFVTHHARGAAPSVAWAVFDTFGLQHFGSAGTLPSGAAPRRDTVYRVASCTKSFTAAAVLALRDAGVLSLDDPLTRFIPAFGAVRLPTTDAPVPTIRMLLTMSAGFPTDDPWADRQESMTADELDALIAQGFGFESVPGTRFAYSNLGYALLGRVIDVASGQRYRDYVRETFLEPLGLTCTGFDASITEVEGGAELAIGQRWTADHWEALPLSAPGAFSPIGGLFSTVTDLCRWAGWLAEAFAPRPSDAKGADDQSESEPLSRASRREMQQLQRLAPELTTHPGGYGFGLFVEQYSRDETVVSHSGGYPGYSAHMRWSVGSGLGIVALENATSARVSVPATEAFDLLLDAQGSPRPTLWAATRTAQQAVDALIRTGVMPDPTTARLFSDNVALDEPWDRRQLATARAITEIGGLAPATSSHPIAHTDTDTAADTEESTGPAQLIWFIPGHAGRLRVEIRLNPQHPPLIQTLKVTADHTANDRI